MKTITIPAKNGTKLEMRGTVIGRASSAAAAPRWTEVSVIRTQSGRYVVHIVGRTEVPDETDRHTTFVCETADVAVDRLHRWDDDGVRFITNVAAQAAERAAGVDLDFRRAWLRQRVA